MRFLLAVTALTVGISVFGAAQGTKPYKVTPSHDENAKPSKSAAIIEPHHSAGGASAESKDLKNLERQTAKTAGTSQHTGKKATGAVLKPEKEQKNPPMNLGKGGSGGGTKNAGLITQPNPYKGRLKQKYNHQ